MTKLSMQLRQLPRLTKQAIAALCDVVLAWMTLLLAFSLRLDQLVMPTAAMWWVYAASPALAIPVFMQMGLYRAVIRYTGLSALQAIAKAAIIYGVLFFGFVLLVRIDHVPRSVGILQPLLLLIGVAVSRALVRFWLNEDNRTSKHSTAEKLIIYGAGTAGIQIAHALNHAKRYQVVGFVDDNPALQGTTINAWRVHAPDTLSRMASQGLVHSALLAIPSLARARRFEILEQLRALKLHVRALPSLVDLASGAVSAGDMQELGAEDLLGRPPIAADAHLMAKTVTGKTVVVTGAAGSIGSELCRQILTHHPKQLILIDHHEFGLYVIERELSARVKAGCTITPLLANVRDADKLNAIFNAFKPQTIYHAAAYKHVPLVEQNVAEGLSTNVLGTLNAARSAQSVKAEYFVLISTDKAVRPTNVMGATKRLAELVLQALAQLELNKPVADRTIYTMVRFGNVLDSSGSVVPLFREQIKAGGPVTLTHPDVTRYFMTIPEAAQLVIQAASMAKGGEVFVLDMGEPVRIADLAKRMIELSGFSVQTDEHPQGDIAIDIMGLRSGEKLYEELLIGDNPEPSNHPKIMKANEHFLAMSHLQIHIDQMLMLLSKNDVMGIKGLLQQLVAGYSANSDVVDWLYQNHSDPI
jgi:FlaA1/EpsC-like NDP-sugar epimerase